MTPFTIKILFFADKKGEIRKGKEKFVGKKERMQNGRKKKVFLLIATEGNVQSQQKLSLFSERPFQGILLSRPPLLQHVDSTLWVELYRRRESPNFYSQCFPRDCN